MHAFQHIIYFKYFSVSFFFFMQNIARGEFCIYLSLLFNKYVCVVVVRYCILSITVSSSRGTFFSVGYESIYVSETINNKYIILF